MTKRSQRKPKDEPEVAKAKIGRPPALEDNQETLKLLSILGSLSCTTKEAASKLEVSEPTFFAFLKRSEKARDAWERGRDVGKLSLRQWQIEAARGGNATMLIWLGKQLLGQKDQKQLEVGNPGDFEKMNKDELREHVRREAEALGFSYVASEGSRASGAARKQLN